MQTIEPRMSTGWFKYEEGVLGFGGRLTSDGGLPMLKEIVPTHAMDLEGDADACRRTRADTALMLRIENV